MECHVTGFFNIAQDFLSISSDSWNPKKKHHRFFTGMFFSEPRKKGPLVGLGYIGDDISYPVI